MWGYQLINGAYGQTPNNPPALLQQLLRNQFGTSAISVENRAVPGATLEDRIAGSVVYDKPFSVSIAQEPAKIVLLNFAINDSNPGNNESPALFQNDLLEFIALAWAQGKIVVLEEPNPVTNPVYANLATYSLVIDNVAQTMNVPLVKQYAYIQSLPNWQSMLTDGGHPNDALYAIKAQREADVIGPIVKSLLRN
ncbi:hypothetical protein PPGU16_17270 [Paraburkholderia largidicola]|uniref:SGNH hydrolase-type esterase domain-containing protein n=2 Tax=Paraburkholderia largidicola TaxID=3014751 RepID=A0A7I8BKI2_9BURK|nr:hypothetical protein PPGU16_17270 [Paraburkholderia sp. PGU16]